MRFVTIRPYSTRSENEYSFSRSAMSSVNLSSSQRPADVERRERILEAAERAFVRHGFHATTMQHVAEEIGMSAGNLYRYFPSKDAIVEGLCALDQEARARAFAELERSPNELNHGGFPKSGLFMIHDAAARRRRRRWRYRTIFANGLSRP